ncbi:unnamed protein product [Ectocarpus sp. CCAP 1310/34]|nr:unnamed protein product [Ectocarpus sp. CCAP 1310/34]
MSVSLSEARQRMISGYGMLAIEDPAPAATKAAGELIATELTGEITPSGSACEGEQDSEGELTRTLSALQRLSVEDQTTLRRKLGAQQQQQSSRCLDDKNRSSSQPEGAAAAAAAAWTKEGKGEEGTAALGVPADSPFRVVLQKAVVEGDLEAAKAALRSGADPNERDDLCHSSLHFAAAKGDMGCLRELMQSGARANVANNVGWSPLHYAVLGGHVSAVEALLRAGAYPCFRDNHLISPLHLASTQACEKDTFRRIAELLGPSALLARDELQQTPLHVAASCGNRGAVSVLLELNADPEATDRKGRVAGQSFLRQVTRRARADIRASLAAAVERIHAPPADADENDLDAGGGGLPPMPGSMKRATSTASCESAEPVNRPSMLSLLQIGGWGGGGGGDASGKGEGETSFSGTPAVVSC